MEREMITCIRFEKGSPKYMHKHWNNMVNDKLVYTMSNSNTYNMKPNIVDEWML